MTFGELRLLLRAHAVSDAMSKRFVALTPRIGAKCGMTREQILDPVRAGEIMDALERYGVLLFPQMGLTEADQVTFSGNLGETIPVGPLRRDGTRDPVYKITVDPGRILRESNTSRTRDKR